MWKVTTGVVLALMVVTGLLFYQNRGLAEDLQAKKATIEDLRYDLQSWEQAGQFWERQNALQQEIVLQREQRNHRLSTENDQLKTQLRGISNEKDPCLKTTVSDDVLNILWDADAKAAAELRGADGDIDQGDTGTASAGTR